MSRFSKKKRIQYEKDMYDERRHYDEIETAKMIGREEGLALEKLRLGDELNIVYDINDSGFFLPPLTLQPIVENAVEHGIAKAECGGTLVIRTRREGDWHEILVADDGTGFDAQTYMSNNKHTHIGVENVRKRIWHQCGGTIVMSSSQGNGTQVIIRIPAK